MLGRLTREQRQARFEEIRTLGGRVLVDARGNPDQARALAHEYVEDAGYGSVWAIIAIRGIMLLIEWWLLRGISDPGDTPLPGEPTVDDMEGDE